MERQRDSSNVIARRGKLFEIFEKSFRFLSNLLHTVSFHFLFHEMARAFLPSFLPFFLQCRDRATFLTRFSGQPVVIIEYTLVAQGRLGRARVYTREGRRKEEKKGKGGKTITGRQYVLQDDIELLPSPPPPNALFRIPFLGWMEKEM